MLVGTNRMTIAMKIPTIIRGEDERARTPLLQMKTVKGLMRENFLALLCGTYVTEPPQK
jgi:phosphomannomutase